MRNHLKVSKVSLKRLYYVKLKLLIYFCSDSAAQLASSSYTNPTMQSASVYSSPSNEYQRPTTRPSYKKPTTTTAAPQQQSYNEPEQTYNAPSPPSSTYNEPEQTYNAPSPPSSTYNQPEQTYNAPSPPSTGYKQPEQTYNAPSPPSTGYNQPEQTYNAPSPPSTGYKQPEQPTYQSTSNSYDPPPADSPLASPEPSYSPPAPAPSYNEPEIVEDNFQYEEPASGYSAPSDDSQSNLPKRQASGFYVGRPPIYTNAVGTPDIWNMFSQEWGGRVSRRRGRLNRRRRVSKY